MGRWMRYSLVPAVAALAAFFTVLPQTGGDAAVEMEARAGGFVFAPESLRIQPGDRVAFTNDSRRTHTATCSDCPEGAEAWDTGDVQPGQTAFLTFPDPGTFVFACRYHEREGMRGTLTVGSPQDASEPAAPATPPPSPGA